MTQQLPVRKPPAVHARYLVHFRLLKFPVLIEKDTTKENAPGVVSTWLNQNGVYNWNGTLSDGSTRLLECQELVEAIHFANTTGMVPE
ncbi:hypothetical protein F443_18483 [Phytophthora nicotianae P1569]|uniref:Uncharacterized protein n=1 Tax=Phytophthora nicotianae P1569 TaxID=1317065 RepID=V9EA34_PHYNI|nr:hypothetical protein F443_18483 [Phytophthora nicotianae P1569]